MSHQTQQPRVLVCGAVYGSTYLRALTRHSQAMTLCGVLGRGGQHSVHSAAQFGVPCYTSLDQALQGGRIDLAAVAISGQAGVELAERLLGMGIPVIQEHPLSSSEIRKLQTKAIHSNTIWHLNSHFGDLPQITPFIKGCQQLNQNSSPLFINVVTNPRTLFSALDILARSLPQSGESKWTKIPLLNERQDFMASAYGLFSGATTHIQYQRTVSARDDGSATLVSHHLQVGYPSGVMELCDTYGPVIWRPNPAHSFSPQNLSKSLWETFPEHTSPEPEKIQHQRDQANAKALEQLLLHATTGTVPFEQAPQHQLNVATMWDELVELFGPPIQIESHS